MMKGAGMEKRGAKGGAVLCKRLALTGIALIFAGFLLVFDGPARADEESVITLTYSNFFPSGHRASKLAEEWCREIEKRTKNRVRFTVYPHNTLVPPSQTYEAVVKGTADVGQSAVAFSPERFPLTKVLSLPLGYRNGREATMTANAFYKKFQPKEFDDVKVMYLHGSPPGFFMTRMRIRKTEDLRGLRIRALPEAWDIVTLVGAKPARVPLSATHDLLRKKELEGVFFPRETLKSWRFGEVIRAVLENYALTDSAIMYVVMNKAKWEALPLDVKEIIEKVNADYAEKQAGLWDELDKEGKDAGLMRAVVFVEVPKQEQAAWAVAARSLYEKYIEATREKDLPGEEALDFCLKYLKKNR